MIGPGGVLYVGCRRADRSLYAVDLANGQVLDIFAAGGAVSSSPAVDADGTV